MWHKQKFIMIWSNINNGNAYGSSNDSNIWQLKHILYAL